MTLAITSPQLHLHLNFHFPSHFPFTLLLIVFLWCCCSAPKQLGSSAQLVPHSSSNGRRERSSLQRPAYANASRHQFEYEWPGSALPESRAALSTPRDVRQTEAIAAAPPTGIKAAEIDGDIILGGTVLYLHMCISYVLPLPLPLQLPAFQTNTLLDAPNHIHIVCQCGIALCA